MRPRVDTGEQRKARRLAVWLVALVASCGERPAEQRAEVGEPDNAPSAVHKDTVEVPWSPPQVDFPRPNSEDELRLSQLGLYRDIVRKDLAPDLIAFEPRYALWSDGAVKRRWLRLPAGATIDNDDPDHFRFPIGSVLFKEFAREGKLLETRVIARIGPQPDDTFMGSFLWRDDESDAILVREGQRDVRGTDHDLPSQKSCGTCHNGEPGRVLGFSAVQAPDVPAALFAMPPLAYVVPGDPQTADALGYLHANCGHCHNPDGSARSKTAMNLRLSLADVVAGETRIEQETIGVALFNFSATALRLRLAPGVPDESALLARMSERGTEGAMPPIATEHVDARGLALVRAWIERLRPEPSAR